MTCHSPFDDDIAHIDSTRNEAQVPESSELERETPGQWPSPSPKSSTSNRRSPIEPSQNNRGDRGHQLVTMHWLARDRHVNLPDSHRNLVNLTGRSWAEAFCDLARVHRPQEPSIASDDSHSHDPPGISPSRDFINDLSLSPKPANGVVQASLYNEYSEAALTLPFHSTEFGSTRKSPQRDNISASTLQSSTSPDKDVTKCVGPSVAYCAPETSIPHHGAPPRLPRSLHYPEPSLLQRTVQKRCASNTQPQPLCIEESCTEDDLIDSAKEIADDTYSPETKPASSSEIRSRAKKFSKSSSSKFGCPQCPRRFTRNFDMLRHIRNIHITQSVETIVALTCTCCGVYLSRKDAFKRHIERVPNSCIRVAKLKQKPPPAILSEETYAIRKMAMMEVCTGHHSSYTS